MAQNGGCVASVSTSFTGVENAVARDWPPELWREVHLVAAVSGGPDSVALLRALATLKQSSGGLGRLYVMHYDHRVRGQQSANDAQWVQETAANLELDCFVGRSAVEGARSEEALRDERRVFYLQTAQQVGARYITTGHNADDQAETVLFRLLRGSGLSGLSGISRIAPLSQSVSFARPLLGVTRNEILTYLDAIGQDYRLDPTNADDQATRNWIRNELIPSASQRFGADVRPALRRAAEQASDAHAVIASLAQALLAQSEIETADDRSRASFLRKPFFVEPLIACEALRLFWRQMEWPEKGLAQRHWESLFKLAVDEGEDTINLPGNILANRLGERIELKRADG